MTPHSHCNARKKRGSAQRPFPLRQSRSKCHRRWRSVPFHRHRQRLLQEISEYAEVDRPLAVAQFIHDEPEEVVIGRKVQELSD
jgi:hypothetical protein